MLLDVSLKPASCCCSKHRIKWSPIFPGRCAQKIQGKSSNVLGSHSPSHQHDPHKQQQLQSGGDDAMAAMLWAAQQEGYKIAFEDGAEDDDDDFDDAMGDLDDPWMRNPAPPEWAESPLLPATDVVSNNNASTSASSTAAVRQSTTAASANEALARSMNKITTVDWQQLQAMALQFLDKQRHLQQQQACVLLLEIECPQQDNMSSCRHLPHPLPWLGSRQEEQQQEQEQQEQEQEQRQPLLQVHHVQVCSMALASITQQVAAEWKDQGLLVAVWDSGHHSCLAAAIRLSAVYQVPDVVLLQQL